MFNEKLKKLRKEKELTQQELAELLHVSRSAVAKWEQNKGIPNRDTIVDICNYFNISKEELFSLDDSLILIENIQNENKKSFNKIIGIFAVIITLIVSVITPIIININAKVNKYYNTFFTQNYLNEVGLNYLEEPENKVIRRINDELVYLDFENRNEFASYVNDLFENVLKSPYISKVSFPSYILNDYLIDNDKENIFLVPSNDLSFFHLTNDENGSSYSIYYLKNLISNRNKKDPVDVYRINLEYTKISNVLEINSTFEEYNTLIQINKISYHEENKINYYLLDDFYDDEITLINNDNFSTYFSTDNTPTKGFFFFTTIEQKQDFDIARLTYKEKIILSDINNGKEYVCEKVYSIDYTSGTDGTNMYYFTDFGLNGFENIKLESIEYSILEPSFILKT